MTTELYYLHTNGDLIHKVDLPGQRQDIIDSHFCSGMWVIDTDDRASAWNFLVEALCSGANRERVFELAGKWGCDDKDGKILCDRLSLWLSSERIDGPFGENPDGVTLFAVIHGPEGGKRLCAGGTSVLETLTKLCAKLGYRRGKPAPKSFMDLVKGRP